MEILTRLVVEVQMSAELIGIVALNWPVLQKPEAIGNASIHVIHLNVDQTQIVKFLTINHFANAIPSTLETPAPLSAVQRLNVRRNLTALKTRYARWPTTDALMLVPW